MLDFLKRFGLGITYVLLSPFILTFFTLYALACFIIFFIELFKGFKGFFKGEKLFSELKEDIEAKRILNLEQYQDKDAPINTASNSNELPVKDETTSL